MSEENECNDVAVSPCEHEFKTAIGCKMIQFKPMTKGQFWRDVKRQSNPEYQLMDDPGYLVKYADGYESWSPAEVFESAYIELENPTKITPSVVDKFVSISDVRRCGNHTVVVANVDNGMQLIQSSACVDADNYDELIGTDLAMKKVKDQLWFGLGFLLAWAKNGIKGGVNTN